jgi:hypothetical protein
MAQNTIPTNAGLLLGLGNKMLAGLISLGSELEIVRVTPQGLQQRISQFNNENNGLNGLRTARLQASDAFHAQEEALTAWLGVVRTVLAGKLGQRWSQMWVQVGFNNGSTAVPTRMEERIALAGRVVAFFTANPSDEVASLNVTATYGNTLWTGTTNAQKALGAAELALATSDVVWVSAFEALTGMMRSLIRILEGTLAADDPRWLAFGLNMPATPATPGQPVDVTAELDGSGAIVVQCGAVPLATRYRWRMRLVGVQPDYLLVARSVDPLAAITGVPPGQTAEIIVQAVNGNLQGVASEPLFFPMPATGAAEPKARLLGKVTAAPIHDESPARTHGNGNGNGNGHTRPARMS